MIQDQINSDVKRLVETLPDEQKEIIILRHYVGMSFKEIADYTDVSINTALGRMRYALLNLRKQITEQNLILSSK
jgi:RNA polymerase sigma-70 factor (ECF subfamily)